ncbi:hypothetical protein QAD02_007588 [Eretmocerus hayati]|uniref:Uncharacterized protein n=1 Tax=Eretmocerus hayati TaxID=131215 RepID=A0ACC2N4W1_9HYME|nr:hypothetical protein QAD02_007588 [Eretmocerus hayati]
MIKTRIEYLLAEEQPLYQDLLNKLQNVVTLKGAEIYRRCNLLPCSIHLALIVLAGITFTQGSTVREGRKCHSRRQGNDWRSDLIPKSEKDKETTWARATSKELANDTFENVSPDQLANNSDAFDLKRRKCRVCDPRQQPNCGECSNCKNMIKSGGPWRSKQTCVKRRCLHMGIQEENDEDPENHDPSDSNAEPS